MKNLFFIVGVSIVLSFFISCSSDSADQPPSFGGPGGPGGGQATSVEVVPIETGIISDQIRSFGTIEAEDVVSVTPQVSDRVTEILVDLGDEISQGQVMARIRDVSFRDAVEQAEAQMRQARTALERDSTQFERQKKLYDQDLISQTEFEEFRATYLSSQAQYESARAALTQSREDLANTEIRSPVDGVVLERMISEGDVATTGQAAFEVANLTGYKTRVYLPRQDWQEVQVGQEVSFSLSNRSSELGQGIVSRKSPRLDPTTGLGEVVISFTETGSPVSQGALVQARINLETHKDVVVIPRSALVEKVETYIEPETGTIELERSYSAFVATNDTLAERRQLELGIEQGDRIEIISGLAEGEGLIITGQSNLEDSSRIRVAQPNFGGQAAGSEEGPSTTDRQLDN